MLVNWAEAMRQNFREFSNEQLSAYAYPRDGHLTTGLLAGVEKTGGTWVHAMMLNYANGFLSLQGLCASFRRSAHRIYLARLIIYIFHEFESKKKN